MANTDTPENYTAEPAPIEVEAAIEVVPTPTRTPRYNQETGAFE
jgi:hypothetical protein